MKRIEIDSLSELDMVAEEILASLQGRSVVVFRGGMGAGKTTLISRMVRLLGSDDSATSPTFALVNQYVGGDGSPIYHFDFYRIDSIDEVFDLGYEEYFYSGDLCLVEWPEKIEGLLPDFVMQVGITAIDEQRRIFEIE